MSTSLLIQAELCSKHLPSEDRHWTCEGWGRCHHRPQIPSPFPSSTAANPLPVTSGKMKLFFVRFWVLARQTNLSIGL